MVPMWCIFGIRRCCQFEWDKLELYHRIDQYGSMWCFEGKCCIEVLWWFFGSKISSPENIKRVYI